MKKHFKVIGLFLCALLIGSSFILSKSSSNKVYADDNSVVGTANLNNTADNSAKIGNQLKLPEIGWQRFDDSDSKIQYIGKWIAGTNSAYGGNWYDSTIHMTNDTTNDSMTFKFSGTEFRIISSTYSNRNNKVDVICDGINIGSFDLTVSNLNYPVLIFEKTGLSSGSHSVTLKANSSSNNMYWMIDAVDIDSTGELIDSSATLATGISLDKTSLDMKTGDTSNLTATVAPDNATNKTVKWTSSDPSIATVDDNGKVTAVKEGSATITATTQDGSNKTATCTVNVKNPADGNALLTVTMTDGQQRSYDITMSQVNDFITWYNNRAGGQGGFTYSFNKTPSSAAYTKRTEYLIYDKISNYDVDEYKAN